MKKRKRRVGEEKREREREREIHGRKKIRFVSESAKNKKFKKGSIFKISFYRFLIGSLFTHHIQKDMKSISYASSGLPLICVRKSFNS